MLLRWMTRRQTVELLSFLEPLRELSDDGVGELLAFATHVRNGMIKTRGIDPLDPFAPFKAPSLTTELGGLVGSFQKANNPAAAAALLVWAHTARASVNPFLVGHGTAMWDELARGMPFVPAAAPGLERRIGHQLDISGFDEKPPHLS
jgi:hypothetical protein